MKTLKLYIGLFLFFALFSSCASYYETNSGMKKVENTEKQNLTMLFLKENAGEFIEVISSSRFGYGHHIRVIGSGLVPPKEERLYGEFLVEDNGERIVLLNTPEIINFFQKNGFDFVAFSDHDSTSRRSFIFKRAESIHLSEENLMQLSTNI